MKVRLTDGAAIGSMALGMLLACAGCASSPPPHPLLAAAPPAPSGTGSVSATPTVDSGSTAAVPPDDERATMGTPDSKHHDRQMRRMVGWMAIGAGTLSTGIAVATSFMMVHQASLRASDCTGSVCTLAGYNANEQLKGLGPWNAGAWILGVAGIGAGVVLLATNPSDASRNVQVSVSPAGALLRGAF